MMSFRSVASLRKHDAIRIGATLLIMAYVVSLLLASIAPLSSLRQSTERRFYREVEKQADTIGYFLSERRRDIGRLALDSEVTLYFQNEALGMSPRYGLRASLRQTGNRFASMLMERAVTNVPLFSSLYLVARDGSVLIENSTLTADGSRIDVTHLSPSSTKMLWNDDALGNGVLLSAPVLFKERLAGYVVAQLPVGPLIAWMNMGQVGEGGRPWMGLYQGNVLLYSPQPVEEPSAALLAETAAKTGSVHVANQSLLRICPIPGTPFRLAVSAPASDVIESTDPLQLALGIGTVVAASLFILLGILRRAQRRREEERLAQTASRLALAARAGGVGIWDFDPVKNTLTWDDQMYRLYGITSGQFSGAYDAWQSGLHPDDVQQGDADIQMALAGEKEFDTEFRVVWPDGGIHNIRALASVQRGATGRAVRMIGTNWEITAQKELEAKLTASQEALREMNNTLEEKVQERSRQLQQAQAQLYLQEKLASIGQLAAGLAHEINNPVSFVSTNVAALIEDVNVMRELLNRYRGIVTRLEHMEPWCAEVAAVREQEKQLNLEFIMGDIDSLFQESRDGFERITSIINSMRGFSRSDPVGSWALYDINKGIRETLVITRHAYRYHADVETEFGLLPEIQCMPSQLNQVFLNLIINAAQATGLPEKADRSRIRIRTWADAASVFCEVADDGPGIAPDVMRRVFEPFFTTKEPGKGTGLGLSICYDIVVSKHRGDLTVDSTPGQGARFTVRLPICLPASNTP